MGAAKKAAKKTAAKKTVKKAKAARESARTREAATGKNRAAKAAKAKKKVLRRAFDVEARLARVPAEAEEILPDTPVASMVVDAARIGAASRLMRARFTNLPDFDIGAVDGLASLSADLQEREIEWQRARGAGRAASLEKDRVAAGELRSDMMASARYRLRKDPAAQKELDIIAEGDGLPDLVQDLRALARQRDLKSAKFAGDDSVPPDASARARGYADRLSAGTDGEAALAAQARRNVAAFALSEDLAEVREAGLFLLRKQPKKAAVFGNTYNRARKQRRRARAAVAQAATEPAAPAPGPTK